MSEHNGFDLINPDAYQYLDNVEQEFLADDSFLREQEEANDLKLFEDIEKSSPAKEAEETTEDSLYANDLFSFDEPSCEAQEEAPVEPSVEEVVEEPIAEPIEEPAKEVEVEVAVEREDQDMFGFNRVQEPEEVEAEIQISEEILSSILEKVSKYSPVKAFLKGCSEDQLQELEDMIYQCRNAWQADRQDKMFSIPDSCLTFAVVTDTDDPFRDIQRLESIAVNMVAHGQELWSIVYVYFDEEGKFVNAKDRQVQKYLFTERQWKTIEIRGKQLANK